MPFELLYVRDSYKIIHMKKLDRNLEATLEYVANVLRASLLRGELLRNALQKMGWPA